MNSLLASRAKPRAKHSTGLAASAVALDENGSHKREKRLSLSQETSSAQKNQTSAEDIRGPFITHSRSSLGSISLNGSPRSLCTPRDLPKDVKGTPHTISDFDSDGNKENIPPLRFVLRNLPRRKTRVNNSIATSSIRTVSPLAPFSMAKSHQYPVNDSSDSSDDEAEAGRPFGHSPRVIRTITSFQRNGKVILRFGRITPVNSDSEESTTTNSSSEDEGHSDEWSEGSDGETTSTVGKGKDTNTLTNSLTGLDLRP